MLLQAAHRSIGHWVVSEKSGHGQVNTSSQDDAECRGGSMKMQDLKTHDWNDGPNIKTGKITGPDNSDVKSLETVSFLDTVQSWDSFYPRDAMRKRGLCCRLVSVRPSRWCIVSTRLKVSSNFLFGPVALSLDFFDAMRQYPIPRGTPSTGAPNTRGWEKFAIFDWNRRLSLKRCEMVTMER